MTTALQFLVTANDQASAKFRALRGEIDGIGKSSALMRNTIGLIGPALAGAFSVAAIAGFVRSSVNGIDALNDLKDATGASIENLSALEDVALRTGTSVETAGSAVVKLNQVLNSASDPDSGAAQAIKAIGLSVDELKRLDPVEALQKIGVALSGFADDGNKGRIIMELFGKSAKDLAPLLNDLAAAGKLQATVTAEQAEAAEAFNKQMFALQKNATDAGRAMASTLLPAINEVFDVLGGGGSTSKLNDWLAVPLQASIVLGGNVAFVLKGIGVEIGGIAAQAAAVAKLDFSGAARIGEMMRADAKVARAEFDKWEARILKLGSGAPQASDSNDGRSARLPSLPATVVDDKPTKGRGTAKARGGAKAGSDDFIGPQQSDALKAALRAIEGTDVAKITALNAQLSELLSIRAADAQGEASLNEAIKRTREELERLDPAVQAAAESKRKLDALLAATPSGQDKERLDTVLLINKAFDDGAISLAQWVELSDQLGSALEAAGETGKTVADELALVFSSAAGEAITNWQGLDGLLKGILQDIAQIALRETVMKPMNDMLGGALKGLGASLAGAFKFADGAAFDAGGIRRFAAGDVFGSPTLFRYGGGRLGLMGEAGPEAIMPLKRGSDGKLGVAASASGGSTINVSINVGAGATVDDWRRSTRQIGSDLQRSLRRAGAIA
jgi:hypothetical protein